MNSGIATPIVANPRWFGILRKYSLSDYIPSDLSTRKRISQDYFNTVLTSDDVRSFAKSARDQYNSLFDAWRISISDITWQKVCAEQHSEYATELELLSAYSSTVQHMKAQLPTFWGRYAKYLDVWQALTDLKKYKKGIRPILLMKTIKPEFVFTMLSLERRWHIRRSTAISVLVGSYPVSFPSLHPLSIRIASQLAMILWLRWLPYKPNERSLLSWILAARSSTLHVKLVTWYQQLLASW
jgi:hypothetical protein